MYLSHRRKSREASETSREEIRRARLLNHTGERDVSIWLTGRKSCEARERGKQDVSGGNHARRARRLGRKSREASETSKSCRRARRLQRKSQGVFVSQEEIMRGGRASKTSQEEITKASETSREEESVWGEGGNLHLTGTVHSICLDNSCYLWTIMSKYSEASTKPPP